MDIEEEVDEEEELVEIVLDEEEEEIMADLGLPDDVVIPPITKKQKAFI